MRRPKVQDWPAQTTWVMRQLGPRFDPETVCRYSGLALYKFPTGADMMGYWRSDGHLMKCRRLTPDEWAWIVANPEAMAAEARQFWAWLDSVRR